MRKLLNKPWFVGTMALAALLLVGHSLLPSGKETGAGAIAPAGTAPSLLPAENETAAEEPVRLSVRAALQALVTPKSGLRDPFAPRLRTELPAAAVKKPAAPDAVDTVHLSALWTQSGATYVLLNDRICQPGDEIGRLKIESATQEGIWVTHWKGRDFISLGGDFTLNTPAEQPSAVASSL